MQKNQNPFYVVSMGKFSALYIATLGLYGLYWFYKNWALVGQYQQRSTQPIFRAVFNIFFFPALCQTLFVAEEKQGEHYAWNPQFVCIGFILLQLLSLVIGYYAVQGTIHLGWQLLQYPILLGHYYFLYKFQLVANRVCQDPFGQSNSTLTPINHAWIVFGIFHWVSQLYTLIAVLNGEPPTAAPTAGSLPSA